MVLSMDRWVGKVAIVTGASSGIGATIVEALVNQGLKVVGLTRRKELIEALSKKLSNTKGKLYVIRADITKEEDILEAFKWVKENLGPVHILINNAGYLAQTTLVDGDTNIWRNTLQVNVLGLCIATREAVRDMRTNKVDGHIIHINSTLGHQLHHLPDFNLYPASKFAVTALTETLRLELMNLKSKIKITSISPGPVNTGMLQEYLKNHEEYQKRMSLDPENIADAVVYVLSTPPHVQIQELMITPVE